jgi:preprotein translocase subunit SecE
MSTQQHTTAESGQEGRESNGRSDRIKENRNDSPPRKKDRKMTAGTHWLFEWSLYKRSQGRITRQATFAALVVIAGIGCWRLIDTQLMLHYGPAIHYGIPTFLFAAAVWLSYRVVNLPAFADFLIAVEAEMMKVSWPTRRELMKSVAVVIVTIIGLAAILWLFDAFWGLLLRLLRVTG